MSILKFSIIDSPPEQRQVSMNNLNLIVNFCENMIECRRAQQLDYFGEHFTREQCLKNKVTACDNCSRAVQYHETDATDFAKMIVSSVQDLCSGNHRFTVLHMVDVLKGAETKKIHENNHNHTKFHGHLKTWERSDIQRLFHKLIIENYLKEEIVIVREMAQSYLKIGPQVARLMLPGSQQRIKFALSEKNQKVKKLEVTVGDQQDDELRDKCYHDLVDIAQQMAEQRGLTIGQIMNMQAISEMSKRMPKTEEEMLQIPHVTKVNFGKFGAKFLEMTQNYSAMREINALDFADEEPEENGEEDSGGGNVDWDAAAREASTSFSGRRGGKRKFSGGYGSSKKRFRTSSGRSKKKSPVKRANTTARGAKTGLMPRPAPKF